MPFADKFRAMMGLPLAGDELGSFDVERIAVSDEGSDWRGYRYRVEMVLHGPGGKDGVRGALAHMLSQRVMTFSSYGNPYELWFGRPAIESLGDKRYTIHVDGAGARFDLAHELARFAEHLDVEGFLADPLPEPWIESYLDQYRVDVKRRVDRYRRRLRR